MKKLLSPLTVLACVIAGTFSAAHACTDIKITAKDGSQVIARTLEFALQLQSDIVTRPRGTSFVTTAPDGQPAKAWKNQYGYIYLDGLKQLITVDGMNEQGLAFEYLFLPGDTQYQSVPAGKNAQAIPYYYFGDWVLGNFKNVDEVKQALANLYVYSQTLPQLGTVIFPLHAAIHDAKGKGIVVEFVKGELQVSDFIGVMTNSPTYQWQVTHLPQFFNLSPYNPQPIIVDGVSYSMNGQGAGMLGLPGDISPSSRFVKMAFMLQYAYQVDTALDAVNLAEHIINNVDIPAGIARSKSNGTESYETTEWTVFKDLTNKIFYYHNYQDTSMRSIDLTKVDFGEKAPQLMMALPSKQTIIDMTAAFSKSPVKPVVVMPAAPAVPVKSGK